MGEPAITNHLHGMPHHLPDRWSMSLGHSIITILLGPLTENLCC